MHRVLDDRRRVGGAGLAGHAAAQAQREPFHDAVHGERHNDRRHAQEGDDDAVDQTRGGAHAEGEQQRIGGEPVLAKGGVTRRIAAPLRTHGTERSIPPMSTTNVCPAATSPTKEATVRIAMTLPEPREARMHEIADDEQHDRRKIGIDDPSTVLGQAEPLEAAGRIASSISVAAAGDGRSWPPRTTATTRKSPS